MPDLHGTTPSEALDPLTVALAEAAYELDQTEYGWSAAYARDLLAHPAVSAALAALVSAARRDALLAAADEIGRRQSAVAGVNPYDNGVCVGLNIAALVCDDVAADTTAGRPTPTGEGDRDVR